MIRDRQLLGKVGLSIGYTKVKKMSKRIFIRNKLDFGDTSSIDGTLAISKNDCSF